MLSLEKRRYLFDVVFLYKVLNGYLNIELTPLLNFYSKADSYKFRHVDDYSQEIIKVMISWLGLLNLKIVILTELLKCGTPYH